MGVWREIRGGAGKIGVSCVYIIGGRQSNFPSLCGLVVSWHALGGDRNKGVVESNADCRQSVMIWLF